ncbi:MAG: 50S ribosomal protein L25, partial [Verrucomicrobia bacterium]|nr:50S ribosomal protein L25 [Verrucomicrobiota bacterium]
VSKRLGIKAKVRSEIGGRRPRRIRASGRVPAILYGSGTAQALELNGREIAEALHGSSSESVLVDLMVEAEGGATTKKMALIREVQHDPLRDTIEHVDFHQVEENKKLRVEVPVHEIGEAVGVRTGGGILDHALRTLRVECLPKDLPERIDVDVSALEVGQSIHVGEVKLPAGVAVLNAKELPVFMVLLPTVEEEVKPGAEGAPTEPEVIREKKDVEGEAAAAPEKKDAAKKEAPKAEAKEGAKKEPAKK